MKDETSTDARPQRRIRSFVRRPGRITVGQKRALTELLPAYGIEYTGQPLDFDGAFGRAAPRVLDIGFGDGGALVTTAARFPDIDYLGIEVHEPGVGHLLVMLERAGLTNVRVVVHDAVDVVANMLGEGSLMAVNLFFPDPWPKKRHHKRRIVQPEFIARIARLLLPTGLLHIATDWEEYAEQIDVVMSAAPQFRRIELADGDAALAFRPPTKFEARGLRLGHTVADFCYERRAPAAEDGV